MSAKELFEKLGYEYEQNDVNQICVCNVNSDEWLWFYLERKTFEYNEEISGNNIDSRRSSDRATYGFGSVQEQKGCRPSSEV